MLMPLPWYLNPWAEVRRLHAQLHSERSHHAEREAGFMRRIHSQKREIEKLEKRVVELEQGEPRDPKPGRVKVTRAKEP